jgi:hypothetical protein
MFIIRKTILYVHAALHGLFSMHVRKQSTRRRMYSLLINNYGRFEVLSAVEDPSLWEHYALSTGKLLPTCWSMVLAPSLDHSEVDRP